MKVIPGMDRANPHATPANSTVQLTKDTNGQERKESWSYRSIIGMPHFQFYEKPKASNERAVKHILRYLLTTQPAEGKESPKYGLHMKPDINRGLEVYVDASFVGDSSKC
eukprot:813687-Ditylum_brightwellii.AAC.1